MQRITSRLTYANIMASIAVFVALGGSSYAAIKIGKNAVGATQIRTGAVRSSEVKDGSLASKDLSSAARAALKGNTGAKGDTGATGAPGPTAGGYAANAGVVGLSGTAAQIVSLAANGTGAITPSFNGRLIVTATGNAHSSVINSDAFCDIRVKAGGGAFTRIGVDNGYGVQLPGAFDNIGTTVTAGTDVTAGTSYDAAMFCLKFNGTTSIDRSQLTAVVVAR